MIIKAYLLLFCTLSLSACQEYEPKAVGQLISDRIELVAETAEPITDIFAFEGDNVHAGEPVLQQDISRIDLQIIEAQANIAGIEAQLEEQINGPRQVTLAVARAAVNEAQVEYEFQNQELSRLLSLLAQDFTSKETVDFTRNRLNAANARLNFLQAQLAEIEAGTRVEQMEQTRQTLVQAEARLAKLMIDKQRSNIAAPVSATLDSLPYEIGERPRPGDIVAVLLTGSQPHARVYIPEQWRINIQAGDSVTVMVDGLSSPLTGKVRRIASEASFTPYFALTENDRGRLTFVAEITLEDRAQRLPEGIPVELILNTDAQQ